MGRAVSLFSGYSQKENRVTNYTLLILKLLYEENQKYLGEVLAALIGEDISSHVGVVFRQQEHRATGIPDGLIIQQALTIFMETKNWDWFYDTQLEKHLESLNNEAPGLKVLLALGKFESEDPERFRNIKAICDQKYRNTIIFQAVSFEDLIVKLQIDGLSKNLSDTIDDFKNFLHEEDLLPSWKEWLDVVNCAGLPEDITEGGVYMCPTEGGAYAHTRCRFFGMYRNKRVEFVAEIEAVVDVDLDAKTAVIKWKNISGADIEFQKRARAKVHELRPDEGPTRIFLLGPLSKTDFQKDLPGGMRGSKQYFNIAKFNAKTAAELAASLDGLKWSELA